MKLHNELLTGAWNTYSESRFNPVSTISQLLQGSFQVLNVTHCSHLGRQLAHVWVQRTQHLLTFLYLVLIWLRKVLSSKGEEFLRIPWTTRRSNQSILKEINLEYSLGGLMLEAEAPALWPPDAKSQLIGKDPDAGKDWGQEEKGTTEDDMVAWHHWLNGHEFEQTLGDGEGQGSLACCSAWGHNHDLVTEQQQLQLKICEINFQK